MTNKMLGVPGYDVDETSLFVRRTSTLLLTAVMTNASIMDFISPTVTAGSSQRYSHDTRGSAHTPKHAVFLSKATRAQEIST